MPDKKDVSLPSLKEIDDMTAFSSSGSECTILCHDLLDSIEQLEGATGVRRLRLLARIRAIRSRMRELKCGLCLPE
jgi:hypothetical protein